MPLLKLETNVSLSADQKASLPASLSKIVAEIIGKPEQYVMVAITPSEILMSGKAGGAAFVDLRSIGGLGSPVNRQLSQRICKVLNETLGVQPNRVYLNFSDVKATEWGWNGDIFG